MTADEIGLSEIAVISTHILTKRMTERAKLFGNRPKHFNSHPHEEDDEIHKWNQLPQSLFQLTSSRRG